jgi:hypothetical protein
MKMVTMGDRVGRSSHNSVMHIKKLIWRDYETHKDTIKKDTRRKNTSIFRRREKKSATLPLSFWKI